ncbi:MAG: tetratricopeptide repeat protein [Phycisphaerales bacterium]|jgi:tetratricopeptide (TPR) repeat protein|nr:tetratricopeptide repeat protein [Phycisphaerales bacterium]
MAESDGPDRGAGGREGAIESLRASKKTVWQVPLLAGAAALLVMAAVTALLRTPAPDYVGQVKRAERQVQREQYKEALDTLNREVLPYLGRGDVSPDVRRAFHILRARAVYMGQRAMGINLAANNEQVIAEYQEAETLNAVLGGTDQYAIGETFLRQGQVEQAIARARMIPDGDSDRRLDLLRKVVERELGLVVPDYQRATDLVSEMMSDPSATAEARVWGLVQQSRIMIDQGRSDMVITRLLRVLPTMEGMDDDQRGTLLMLLGEAYLETDAVDQARTQLERAEALVEVDEESRARTQFLLGRALQRQSDWEGAATRYRRVRDNFGETRAFLPALLGLGEVEGAQAIAAGGEGAEAAKSSLSAYRLLAERMREDAPPEPKREEVVESLVARVGDQLNASSPDRALAFAEVALSMYPVGDAPASVLLAMADSRRAAARALVPEGVSTHDLDTPTTREMQRHLISAAEYFRQYAERMLIADHAAHTDALWESARLFDEAGDLEAALFVLRQFVDSFPSDPRRAEAKYRLGTVMQARGDYASAEAYFEELIAARGDRSVGEPSGPWGDAAFVPLAQCLRLDGDPSNDARAEQILLAIVDGGELGTPESEHFRQASFELGALYSSMQRWDEAIGRLEAALDRFGEDPQASVARYQLAEAYRQSASEIATELDGGGLPPAERTRLEDLRAERLGRAIALFERVRDELEARDPRLLSLIEASSLRNAYFHLGACAFALGEQAVPGTAVGSREGHVSASGFERAIGYYQSAKDKYGQDPASLVALVQIVNAYVAMGQPRAARVAHEIARRFYASMPATAWDDPNLPMTRREWERWLDSTVYLQQASVQAP